MPITVFKELYMVYGLNLKCVICNYTNKNPDYFKIQNGELICSYNCSLECKYCEKKCLNQDDFLSLTVPKIKICKDCSKFAYIKGNMIFAFAGKCCNCKNVFTEAKGCLNHFCGHYNRTA